MTLNTEYLINLFRKDGTIKISAVSPNGKYFFKIKEPKDLYWGLFCCPISFFDIEGNLIYYNNEQYAECVQKENKKWSIVNWSSSGNIAFFLERNSTKSFQYVLLNLRDRTISKTDYQDQDKNKLTDHLFKILLPEKAREVYYEIISQSNYEKAIQYIETLDLIEDKRELNNLLRRYYYNDFNLLIKEIEKGSFDDDIIANSALAKFVPITSDELNKNIFELFGFNKWRP